MKDEKSMKRDKLWLVVLIAIICSCQGKNADFDGDGEGYKIDTVMVATGDELLYLGDELKYLGYSDMSSDKSTLYILDYENINLIVIDLVNFKLEKIIDLEIEGPYGIGDWVSELQVVNDSTLTLMGNNSIIFINPNGKLIKKVNMDHLFYLNDDLLGKYLEGGYLYNDGQFYLFPRKISSLPSQLMVYNPEDDSYKLIFNPYADLLKSNSVTTWINKSSFTRTPVFYLKKGPSGAILASSTLPQIFTFSVQNNTFGEVFPDSKYVEEVEKTDEILEVHGQEAADEWRKGQEKKMRYLLPEWDSNTEHLYRWAYKLASDGVSYENYLFISDSTYKLVKEYRIEGIEMKPRRMLIIGSKIYLAANFDDELGFLVYDFKHHLNL